MDNKQFRKISGEESSNDKVVALLYLLTRDHLPVGVVERIVTEIESNSVFNFTNGFLAKNAKVLAKRLVSKDKNKSSHNKASFKSRSEQRRLNEMMRGDWQYKNNTYGVERVVRMKDLQTGEWKNAILYSQWCDRDLNYYVRDMEDFLSKFKKVEE